MKKIVVFILLFLILIPNTVSCAKTQEQKDVEKINKIIAEYRQHHSVGIFNYTDILKITPELAADIYIKSIKYENIDFLDFLTMFPATNWTESKEFNGYGMNPDTNELYTNNDFYIYDYHKKYRDYFEYLYGADAMEKLDFTIISEDKYYFPEVKKVVLDFSNTEKQPGKNIIFSFKICEIFEND